MTEYVDHGVSGARERRPGLDRVERDLKDVKAEVVALKSLGLRLREISSVRFLQFLRRRIHPGYWHGEIGAFFGSDVIFVADKPRGQRTQRHSKCFLIREQAQHWGVLKVEIRRCWPDNDRTG